MPRRSSTLAKLTRPRLHGATERARLFIRLDECRSRNPAVCVVGPPGAGKTTLVATWLDSSGAPGLWYQVDAGDADVATFFYYLVEAAAPYAEKARQTLPLLTPEYQHDVAGFSRRFFRQLFGLLPPASVLVLDNYQEVGADLVFHELVAQAVAEIPAGSTLVAISRHDPPDSYARLIANERVGFVDWDDLKLHLDEAQAIIRARLQGVADSEEQLLFEESGGWAAGLTLILSNYRRHSDAPPGLPTERESIFRYFATQIFERLPPTTRVFLASTAVLSQVPVSLARDLTGNARANEILEELHKTHLFTHRRPGAEPTYWYHALFREFLRDKAAEILTTEAVREIERKAARLLEARQDVDGAFQLFHEAGDWQAARRMIERHASTLLAQGRGQTLRDWVVALPAGILEDAPWLRYWLGTSLIAVDQKLARSNLEHSFAQFAASSDLTGEALSAAGVIDTYFFEWSDFKPMRRWLDMLSPVLDAARFSADPASERRIYTSALLGMLYAAPDHRLLPRTVERVTEMLDEEMDVNSKVATAMILMSYCNLACDMDRCRIAVACADALMGHPELTPFNRLWWCLRKGYYLTILGRYPEGRDALNQAGEIAQQHGLHSLRRTYLLTAAYQIYCVMLLDPREVRRWHQRIVARASPDRPMDVWHVVQAKVHVECIAGNYVAMADSSRRATGLAAQTGMQFIEILGVDHEAAALAVIGDLDRFDDALVRLRRMIAGTCFAFLECHARFLEAFVDLVHGDAERGRTRTREAVAFSRQRDFQFPQMSRYTVVVPTVLAEALRLGVERDYVVDLIGRLRVPAPPDAPEAWPWVVRIRTLGSLEIERDGAALEFPGRAPRRVLALLKAIVAAGDRPVPSSRLTDALWQECDGDAGRKALDVSLVRLRKLLGDAESVQVRDEHIVLNRAICWVDAWAFSDAVKAVDRDPKARIGLGLQTLELYRGDFLPADEDDRSVVVMRLRMRDQFARLVLAVGQEMEASGDWSAALACYRRGIDADELAEDFYQGVMRCYAATGRAAEGIAVYRRLRQTLSVVLGMSPSARTEQLVQMLRSGNPGSAS